MASACRCPGIRRSGGGEVGTAPGPRATARTSRPHNDTWIAACCLVDELPLATLNTKDFADFAEHERADTYRRSAILTAAEPAAADSRSEPPRPEQVGHLGRKMPGALSRGGLMLLTPEHVRAPSSIRATA